MRFVNELLRPLFDVVLYPFRNLSPMVGIVAVSLVTAIGMLLIFKKTSNQTALEAVKKKIHASLFEIRLFNDDLRAIMRAQFDILRNNLTYLKLSMVPMVWTLPPLVLVIAQLQFHYGYEGLAVGQETILKVALEEGAVSDSKPQIRVEAPSGLSVVTPPVWVPSLREMSWRLVAEAPGEYELTISGAGGEATKSVQVADAVVRRSPFRIRGFLNELLYPAEPPLPGDCPYESITVTYPAAEVSLLGWGTHWLIAFFILSIVFAFVLKKPFGVTI